MGIYDEQYEKKREEEILEKTNDLAGRIIKVIRSLSKEEQFFRGADIVLCALDSLVSWRLSEGHRHKPLKLKIVLQDETNQNSLNRC